MLYFSWIYFSSIFWNQILHQLNKKNANLNFFLGIRVLPASVLLHHMCTHVVTLMSVVSLGLYNPIPWKSKVCFVLLFFFLLLFNCNPSLTYYLMTVKFVDDSCQLKPYIQVDPTYKNHWALTTAGANTQSVPDFSIWQCTWNPCIETPWISWNVPASPLTTVSGTFKECLVCDQADSSLTSLLNCGQSLKNMLHV